ncbi:hypothetical protein [Clostridium botulinum]|uniref:hypothetical protein n=1 Tax=Clostridium botulinum TaxID=1491 RepID=UPI001301A07C|nr:hypothetical protein [Clostridium botulinum]
MENMSYMDINELETINGGDKIDVALAIGGLFCPQLGALGAIKTLSDWVDSQPW